MAVDQGKEQVDDLVLPDSESYKSLLDEYTHLAPAEGEVRQGTILKITAKDAIVDFGYKSEGSVPIEQFRSPSGELTVQAGDVVDVMIDHGEQPEGYILLSHAKAARVRVWDNLEKAFADQLVLLGHVLGRVKGGLSVDVGIEAFMPGSQVDPRPIHHLDSFIGQDVPVKIVKANRRRGNVVVSRKLAVEQEINQRKAATLDQLSEGAIVTGVVKNLTEYGAFIDLGGLDGLLHVTDISYGRVGHPSEIVHVGDTITAKVLKFDRAKERVSLGLRQMAPDPWETVAKRFPVNGRVMGQVVNVTDYGAFVELEPGVEGLIHITEMTWSRRMKHPSKVVRAGDQVEAVVLEVNPRNRRISLGLKQLEANPWTTIDSRYSIGSVVEGRVRNMTDFGVFIEIEEGIDGLVHVSDLSWTKRVKHPSEVLKKGQLVQAAILNIDAKGRRLSLGIKQLQPDAWETYLQNHQAGDIVHGRISRLAGFGAFVELADGVEGLCHFSEVPGYTGRRSAEASVALGQEYDFKIVKMSEAEKKIGLSLKAVAHAEEKGRLADYQRQAAAGAATIEEVLSLKNRGGE
jgi:small subunit ribosomal protein S1